MKEMKVRAGIVPEEKSHDEERSWARPQQSMLRWGDRRNNGGEQRYLKK
jgi:hypothetical protein